MSILGIIILIIGQIARINAYRLALIKKGGEYMANRKTSEEKLKEIDIKLNQLKIQKQNILKKENARLRKERTRRLIQIGALAEKYFNVPDIDPKDFEDLLKNSLKIKK